MSINFEKRLFITSKSYSYQDKIILNGISQSNGHQKIVEVHDKEKRSLESFLEGQNSKIVELDKVIGIGGEGIVLEKESEIEIMQGNAKDRKSIKAENIQLKSKERSFIAMKFVKFELDANEDFQGDGFKRVS